MANVDKLKQRYNDEIGPLPYWLIKGASDDYVAGLIVKALARGSEITHEDVLSEDEALI